LMYIPQSKHRDFFFWSPSNIVFLFSYQFLITILTLV
jgi:hypothetical protein